MNPPLFEFVTVYCTTSSADEAHAIATALVQEKLAACANIVPVIQSIYEWQGECHRDAESALILKTRAARFAALAVRVQQLHSYDCPCITATPIVAVSRDYAAWLREQTSL